jgi:hypothetical protein
LTIRQELFGEGRRYFAPDSRAGLSLLFVDAQDVTDHTDNLVESALRCSWCRCNKGILFGEGVVGVGLDGASSRQTRDEYISNIHYVFIAEVLLLTKEIRIGRGMLRSERLNDCTDLR